MRSEISGTIRSISDAVAVVRGLRYTTFVTKGRWPLDKFPFGLWFRGHARPDCEPEPRVFRRFRPGSPVEKGRWDETNVFEHLKLRVPNYQQTYQTAFDWLCLMQHYSVPTRLLDWSESILPALYFAVKEDPSEEGELIVLNARRLNASVKGRPTISAIGDHGVVVRSEMAMTRSAKKLARYASVRQALAEAGVARRSGWLQRFRAPIAVFPSRLNDRMVFQASVFTLHGGKQYLPQMAALYKKDRMPTPITLDDVDGTCRTAGGIMKRYRVTNKQAILDDLLLLGIHEGTLFPEVDHQAVYLGDLWWFPDVKADRVKTIARGRRRRTSR